jgi:glycosyltransferase involved in cell wall biosynthesis
MNVRPLTIRDSDSERRVQDPDLLLRIPESDVEDPELSIVIPALNEKVTIAMFVDWCMEGLRKANIRGEVLIIDSSSDETPEIALSRGARVLKSPKRGLGRAYIDALPYVRGRYILMGDADCTYDFRDLEAFVKSFRSGYEYVMGSRFSRLYRARFDASTPSVPRNTCDDVASEFPLFKPFLRYPLRHARDYNRRFETHGSAVAVLGIRVGDGVEIRSNEPSY